MDRNIKYIKSYSKVWKIERRFYGFGGFHLSTPIGIYKIIYFALSIALMAVVGGFITSPIIRFVVVPGFLAWLLDQKLIDSKNPYQFIRSLALHYIIVLFKGPNVSRFRHYKLKIVAIKDKISYRVHHALDNLSEVADTVDQY